MKKYLSTIEIPVQVTEYTNEKGEIQYMVSSTEETLKHTGNCHFVVSTNSLDESKSMALYMRALDVSILHERSRLLDCCIPLKIRKSLSSFDITIFGFMIWFRKSNLESRQRMKGGTFIPFTNINVLVRNIWKTRYKHETLKLDLKDFIK